MPSESESPHPDDFLAALEKWKTVRDPGEPHALLDELTGEWHVSVRFHGAGDVLETDADATGRIVHGSDPGLRSPSRVPRGLIRGSGAPG